MALARPAATGYASGIHQSLATWITMHDREGTAAFNLSSARACRRDVRRHLHSVSLVLPVRHCSLLTVP